MTTGTDVERAFLIADLSGYTALTEAHGNLEAAKVVTRYLELARETGDPLVRLVERVGDELVFVSDDSAALVATAARLRDAVEREPRFPRLRAGLNLGPVLEQGGQFFGAALNLAARVAEYARAGQILCTEGIAARVTPLGRFTCRSLGAVRFKNVSGAVTVFELVEEAERRAKAIDPVCRMQVDEETAPARLPWAGRTWHFCSFECARAFAGRPEDYAS
ncbi:MAG: YHS domain-containing protein [Candidatus Rokubacteria bacterium]|nr:YHS domain-containing protein [Candidatus Rokubacteria bacterium]